jgi:hypothetical protein
MTGDRTAQRERHYRVGFAGDSVVAEFSSAVEASLCAVEI